MFSDKKKMCKLFKNCLFFYLFGLNVPNFVCMYLGKSFQQQRESLKKTITDKNQEPQGNKCLNKLKHTTM